MDTIVNKDRLNEILSFVPFLKEKDFLLCGGTVRYICGYEDSFRDIDIIISNDTRIPDSISYKKNMYGGYKIISNNIEVDLWSLKNHIIPCNSFDEVQETWLISYDAIFYRPKTDTLYDKYFNSDTVYLNKDRDVSDTEKDYLKLKVNRLSKRGLSFQNELIGYADLTDTKTVSVKNIDPLYHDDYQIDASIAPVIELLNKKGYKTWASCSGHKLKFRNNGDGTSTAYENIGGYISLFNSGCTFPKPPKSLRLRPVSPNEPKDSIYWDYDSEEINNQRMKDLFQWVETFSQKKR